MAEPRMQERSLLTKALSPSNGCATPFELSTLAEGSLTDPAVARLHDHVSACPRCQTELTLLSYFESGVPAPDEERTVRWISARLEEETIGGPSLPRRAVSKANLAGFGVAVAVLGVATTIGLRERRTPVLAEPSLSASTVLRSATITVLSPAEELDAAPESLRWERQAGADSYSVQLMEVDHAPLWSAETREATLALPQGLRAGMVPGKPLLWEVVAKDPGGRPVAWSGTQRFSIKRDSHPKGD